MFASRFDHFVRVQNRVWASMLQLATPCVSPYIPRALWTLVDNGTTTRTPIFPSSMVLSSQSPKFPGPDGPSVRVRKRGSLCQCCPAKSDLEFQFSILLWTESTVNIQWSIKHSVHHILFDQPVLDLLLVDTPKKEKCEKPINHSCCSLSHVVKFMKRCTSSYVIGYSVEAYSTSTAWVMYGNFQQ